MPIDPRPFGVWYQLVVAATVSMKTVRAGKNLDRGGLDAASESQK
jgi:hypothetical protein